jgi:prepilin-type N-terminal cleavage/methylation domain-containing protein
MSRQARNGFTMLELLVVVAIIAITAGMIAFVPRSDRRDADVRAAAEELAATLRQARAIAIQQMSITGVAFNIRNGLGTSGKVLNNHDGGHWYRIIGSNEIANSSFGDATYYFSSYPRAFSFGVSSGTPTSFTQTPAGFMAQVAESWAGDQHVLAAHRVRFLALSDQDNGFVVKPLANEAFPATYPRPWFGYWSGGILYPWGGYDRANYIRSGFCYEGNDANGGLGIVGCANPADRWTTWETSGPRQIFAAGKGRPLVNGDWLDYILRFYPDGTVDEGPIMEARFNSCYQKGAAGSDSTGGIPPYGDLGDMSALAWGGKHDSDSWYETPMTSYVRHTGVYAITLCPDIDQDTNTFGSAKAALATMWPMYRVTVNQYGFVQVVRVKPAATTPVTWDTTIAGTGWQTAATVKASYAYCYATGPGLLPRGMPVTDWVSDDLLASRNWWTTYP